MTEPSNPIAASTVAEFVAQAREVFLSWEKLRVLYIVLLALVVFGLGGVQVLDDTQSLFAIIEGAFVANVLYFAGPLAESYARWLGVRWRWLRTALFVGGTLLAIALTAFTMLGIAMTHLFDDMP